MDILGRLTGRIFSAGQNNFDDLGFVGLGFWTLKNERIKGLMLGRSLVNIA